jgi:hypothetical protein
VLTAHPDLSPEQAALVWELTISEHRIENVEAGAGAGKTHALGVAVEALGAAGIPCSAPQRPTSPLAPSSRRPASAR